MLVPPIADHQDGVFSRRQATAAGISRWIVTRRLNEGTWRPIVGDVYVLAGVPITPERQARAASLATGGVVSHLSAAVLHGLDLEVPTHPHVITRPRVHIAVEGVIEHRMRLASTDRALLDGIAVTTRRRTLVDVLATSPWSSAATLLFRAVQQGWLTAETLREDIDRRRNMTGTPQLRRLAALLGTGAHSVAERMLHDILKTATTLDWRANVRIATTHGSFVADVLVPSVRLVIEIDGRRFHGADRFQSDRSRQNALVGDGYVVLRFTWLDLVEREAHVHRTIASQVRLLSAA